ncbi:hypothetical protein PoB_001853300 [Plakobranchus ocellatus]|uniref:Uncharacterized protein n=1 Tax=Plakobranchus ocellatus TaxID=259542 RepID=A0AAV3ZBE1_9GAST|nr:hypothetical protein PoB_001853300 [Plakobranchus ocellatus]
MTLNRALKFIHHDREITSFQIRELLVRDFAMSETHHYPNDCTTGSCLLFIPDRSCKLRQVVQTPESAPATAKVTAGRCVLHVLASLGAVQFGSVGMVKAP